MLRKIFRAHIPHGYFESSHEPSYNFLERAGVGHEAGDALRHHAFRIAQIPVVRILFFEHRH